MIEALEIAHICLNTHLCNVYLSSPLADLASQGSTEAEVRHRVKLFCLFDCKLTGFVADTNLFVLITLCVLSCAPGVTTGRKIRAP